MSDTVKPSIGEKIERNVPAQIAIAIALVAVLLAQAVTHMPGASAVEDELGPSANYLVRLGAMEAQWGVFAPNPRGSSWGIEGRVTFEDGSTAVWHLPDGARIGGNLRYYRWRKWLERARGDDFRTIWEPTCQWIASLYDEFDSPVETVELVRRFHENRVQGEPLPYNEFVYHTCTPDGAS